MQFQLIPTLGQGAPGGGGGAVVAGGGIDGGASGSSSALVAVMPRVTGVASPSTVSVGIAAGPLGGTIGGRGAVRSYGSGGAAGRGPAVTGVGPCAKTFPGPIRRG